VPNPERKLLPGMYGSVNIVLARTEGALGIPASALIVSEHGARVAQVDTQGRVHMRPVVVERDRGTLLEIASGLQGDEQIVANPGPSLQEGSHVRVAQPLLTAVNSR
jgi:multidrug efflux pump subunit AcrA (membrane-fusion protein)